MDVRTVFNFISSMNHIQMNFFGIAQTPLNRKGQPYSEEKKFIVAFDGSKGASWRTKKRNLTSLQISVSEKIKKKRGMPVTCK